METSASTQAAMPSLNSIKHLALDLDGTLYLDGKLFPYTPAFLQTLDRLQIGRTFFTNNSSKSTAQYIAHLRKLGINAGEADVYSSTRCTMEFLQQKLPHVKRVYILGTPALKEEFFSNGFTVVGESADEQSDAVIVGFDTTLDYERLCRAAWWISKGKPFIATHCDRVCPTSEATIRVDCGAICAMLSSATGRKPDAVLGKPHPLMLSSVIQQHKLSPEQIGVVGDRIYTDIAMAKQAGALGILVLSGETTKQLAQSAEMQPDLIVADVGELGRLLEKEREGMQC